MSINKSIAQHRLSLLTGSSLAALCLMAAVAALAPTTARAANECGDPAANPGADSFTCSGEQASVTYVTDGDLNLNLDDDLSITEGGLSITGSGTDAITVFPGATIEGTDVSIVSTTGAGLTLLHSGTTDTFISLWDSDEGDGLLSLSGVTQGASLTNTGGGGLYFAFYGPISASAGNGVEASGLSRLDIQLFAPVTASGVGVLATTEGPITMVIDDVSASTGIQAVTTGSGSAYIVVNGDVAGSDTGILFDAAGEVELILSADGSVTGEAGGAVRVTGGTGPVKITNAGEIDGQLLIAGEGVSTIVNNGVWRTTGANLLSEGQAVLSGAGVIVTNTDGAATSLDFGAAGEFNPGGTLAVGAGGEAAATLSLLGLGSWTNSATVLFGANADLSASDGVTNDRIVASGADFEGAASVQGRALGTLVMDVQFAGQADCAAAVTADCLDLSGGGTSGLTSILVNPVGGGAGGSAPIVLVDLGGGEGAQGDFELDPLSPGYRAPPPGEAATTATIDGGLFRYALRYLEDSGQHALVGFPDVEVGEMGLIGDAALAAWDLSAGQWLQRQADLRDTIGENAPDHAMGAWIKVANNKVDYTLIQHVTAFGTEYGYNTSYAQDTKTVLGGVDLLNTMGAGQGWVVGVMGSKTTSDLDFRTSPTAVSLEGHSLGAYASMAGRLWYLDALVNSTTFDLEYDSGPLMDTGEVASLGVQLEGGFRFLLADGFAFAEPLVAWSHVTTEFPDLNFSGVEVLLDENTTSRGALGLRIGGRLPLQSWTAAISGTGRVWDEFEGADHVTLISDGPDAGLITDTSELLGDIGGQIGVFSNDLRFSASVDVAHRFKQDYSSTDLSLSLRYWF